MTKCDDSKHGLNFNKFSCMQHISQIVMPFFKKNIDKYAMAYIQLTFFKKIKTEAMNEPGAPRPYPMLEKFNDMPLNRGGFNRIPHLIVCPYKKSTQ